MFLVVLLLAGCGQPAAAMPVSQHQATPSAVAPSASTPPPPRISYPAHGSRTWHTAPAQSGPAAGHAGQLLRYRVLVEKDIHGLDTTSFADAVTTTLSDPQSWTAGGRWRLQRVGPGQSYDFTIYLATPDTRDVLCGDAPDGYTSCRNGDSVVLNVARWVKGVPHYGAGLAVYRQYMVNHEVGHRLGHGHQLCPGPGRLAPTMQQQTLGLHGCVANPWPYPNGRLYAGPSGAYNDKIPPRDTGQTAA